MVWLILLVVLVVVIVAAIVYDRHQMQQRWEESTRVDAVLFKEAVVSSMHASNSFNPMVALEETVRAHRTVETLVQRYGLKRAQELTGLDVEGILRDFARQRDRIRQEVGSKHPELLPKGDLLAYVGYIREREEELEDEDEDVAGENY
jgi:hypothetical protein